MITPDEQGVPRHENPGKRQIGGLLQIGGASRMKRAEVKELECSGNAAFKTNVGTGSNKKGKALAGR
jgi:hypothetical protein